MSSETKEKQGRSLARVNKLARALAPELLVTIVQCRKQIDHIIEDGAPTDWRMWRDDLDAVIARAEGLKE